MILTLLPTLSETEIANANHEPIHFLTVVADPSLDLAPCLYLRLIPDVLRHLRFLNYVLKLRLGVPLILSALEFFLRMLRKRLSFFLKAGALPLLKYDLICHVLLE